MKTYIKDYAEFIGSYLIVTWVFLIVVNYLDEAPRLYIRFQSYIDILFIVGFLTMLIVFIWKRAHFKTSACYRIHLISIILILVPTLVYELLFDSYTVTQTAENVTLHREKLYFYYFIFVMQAYIFGTLILLVNAFIRLNKMSILYSLLALVACLFGYFFVIV